MFDWLLGKRVLIVRIHVYPPGRSLPPASTPRSGGFCIALSVGMLICL